MEVLPEAYLEPNSKKGRKLYATLWFYYGSMIVIRIVPYIEWKMRVDYAFR